jgi:hypothetical protein
MGNRYEIDVQSGFGTGRPLGVTVVTLLTVAYGLLWLLSGLAAIHGQSSPDFTAFVGPSIGFSFLLLAIGIWDLWWPAWAFAVAVFFGIISWHMLVQPLGMITLDQFPFVPVCIILYLFFRQDLYFEGGTGTTRT